MIGVVDRKGTDLGLLRLDARYRDRNRLPIDEREAINHDHRCGGATG